MKYILFAGHNYYPRGGVRDMAHRAEAIEECQRYFVEHAKEIAASYIDNWAQIVEHETMKTVLFGEQRGEAESAEWLTPEQYEAQW